MLQLRFIYIFLFVSATLSSAQSTKSSPIEISIIRQLKAPFPLDSTNIDFNANDSHSFMSLIRLANYGRRDTKKYAEHAFAKAYQRKISWELGLAYAGIARTTTVKITSDTCTEKAIAIFEKENLQNLQLLTQLHSASSLVDLGANYVKAFTLVNDFLTNYEVKDDRQSYAIAWNILGEIYRNIHNNAKALECYKKSAQYAFDGSTYPYSSPIINMGTIYKNLGKYDSAFYLYDLVMTYDTSQHGSKYAYILNRKAQIYLLLHNYEEAENHVVESLALYEKLNSKVGIILSLCTSSQVYFVLNNLKGCILAGERAIKLGLQAEFFPEEFMETCKLMVRVFEKAGNFDKALYYQKTHDEIYSRLFGPSTNAQMLHEQLGLEERNLNLEKSILREEQRLAKESAKAQQQILFLILGAFLLAVIAIVLLYRKNSTIKSLNDQLHERQDEILTQSEQLKATNEEIEAINSNLEGLVKERSQKIIEQNERLTNFAYFNAHKVRGPLARILGLISIMELDLKKETIPYSEMLKQAGIDLDNSISEINIILQQEDKEPEASSTKKNTSADKE